MIFSHITFLPSVITVIMTSKVPDLLRNDSKHSLPHHLNESVGKILENTGDIWGRNNISDDPGEDSFSGIVEKSDDSGSQKQFPVYYREFVGSTNEKISNQTPVSSNSENLSSRSESRASSRADFDFLFEEIARIQNLAETLPLRNFDLSLQVYAYIIELYEDFWQKLQASNSTQWHKYPEYDEFQQIVRIVHQKVKGMRKALQRPSYE